MFTLRMPGKRSGTDVARASFLFVLLSAATYGASGARILQAASPGQDSSACPLTLSDIFTFRWVRDQLHSSSEQANCAGLLAGLNVTQAMHLRKTGSIYMSPADGYSCITALQAALVSEGVNSSLVELCGISAGLLSDPTSHCRGNVSTLNIQSLFTTAEIENFNRTCKGHLPRGGACTLCTSSVVLIASRLQGNDTNGLCFNAINIYAAGAVNEYGPLDTDTAMCLFNIEHVKSHNEVTRIVGIAVGGGVALAFCLSVAGFVWYRWKKNMEAAKKADKDHVAGLANTSKQEKSSLVWYDMDEIKAATRNFHRDTIIGSGAYGNVFKGQMADGSWVALKRFKNCSPAGDADFFHEVDVVASVRHRNLVGLKGCAVISGTQEGHQRIIVLEYVPNGSLQDHIFGNKYPPLDWPTRRKIAIGTARGLDYLHNSVKPAILHRDVKPSNILLDEDMNALVADFGLAKFTPDGITHLTTRAGGTRGYIAPEYALFGQLSEKSDVYSFGIVLLELITGNKALSRTFSGNDSPVLISERVWEMVKVGRTSEVLDQKMECVDSEEKMCRFVFIALLCAHNQVNFRPTMKDTLKLLENDHLALPVIPDRHLPLTSTFDEIERSVGGSEKLSTKSGFQCFSSSSSGSSRSGASSLLQTG
eukprot:TRINITY_DN2226_c0_g2_i2.p1 TRINITY_DN2226_c0_g2~~TRINITY_DN2226_c0_g2_i2.p1  ORF type:complete len:649 (-),score=96.44 TRINITY_DN2226_c0_g2_i2:1349-3295(-)